MNVADALDRSRDSLARAGIETARLDARLLVERALALGDYGVLTERDRPLSDADQRRLRALMARRLSREPMAHILSERGFWKHVFKVSPATLVPRPDSETLIEAVSEHFPERAAALRVLDLGTGSGCLLLSVLDEYPNATGVGIDRSIAALSVARENAFKLRLSDRAHFVAMDWARGVAGCFDAIVCNPPYIPAGDIDVLMPEVSRFEPRDALAGGADGLESYRVLAPRVAPLLTGDGRALFEVGAGQAACVAGILAESLLQVVEIKDDLSGIPRCVVARKTDR
ncbi:MAG: peptide chain release factor N(5)-glutamine methyltransferase [Rhodospirillales bacterium]